MRSLRFVCPAVLLFLLAACEGTSPSQPGEVPSPVLMGGVPEGAPMDPAEIVEARVEGDVLHLKVRHGGGCKRHDFSLVHSGVFMKSLPPQTYVTLSHDANGDACEALLTTDLAFDLSPLRRALQEDQGQRVPLVVHVRAPGSVAAAATVLYVF